MTKNDKSQQMEGAEEPVLSRRTALARLGLAATVAYAAPTIMHIDRSANALVVPSPCSTGRGRRRQRCKKKGGKNKSGKSKNKGGGRSGRGRRNRSNRRRQANNRRRNNNHGNNRRRW